MDWLIVGLLAVNLILMQLLAKRIADNADRLTGIHKMLFEHFREQPEEFKAIDRVLAEGFSGTQESFKDIREHLEYVLDGQFKALTNEMQLQYGDIMVRLEQLPPNKPNNNSSAEPPKPNTQG